MERIQGVCDRYIAIGARHWWTCGSAAEQSQLTIGFYTFLYSAECALLFYRVTAARGFADDLRALSQLYSMDLLRHSSLLAE